ncbi:MAG: hypothetical protein N2645_11270 [Clostridia bacterium]|nr:hypothetical protein [Clostridia bacterium]
MNNIIRLKNLNENNIDIYQLEGFEAKTVDSHYLHSLQVKVIPSSQTLWDLTKGSILFKERLKSRSVIPKPELIMSETSLKSELEIHNYTGACPALTYEINPVTGCNVGCLYCLVTDGVHENRLHAYSNYHLLVRRVLEENYLEPHYYYFSPKTEAFQEPTLQTGIAHNILREFIAHFEKYPESKARIFIASKAGTQQLSYKHKGESILDLFCKLKDKMQFNTSVSMMPPELRSVIEPYAATIEDRLNAVLLCQEKGILSNSALVQPIIAPYLTDEIMHEFFSKLKKANIINYKPEFLTVCMENLAMLGQISGYFDKSMEKKLYEYYIAPENAGHRKQRGRTAPSRELSKKSIRRLMEVSSKYGLSISICYWVRQQLYISEEEIPLVNENGFQCLGYQTRLFEK